MEETALLPPTLMMNKRKDNSRIFEARDFGMKRSSSVHHLRIYSTRPRCLRVGGGKSLHNILIALGTGVEPYHSSMCVQPKKAKVVSVLLLWPLFFLSNDGCSCLFLFLGSDENHRQGRLY